MAPRWPKNCPEHGLPKTLWNSGGKEREEAIISAVFKTLNVGLHTDCSSSRGTGCSRTASAPSPAHACRAGTAPLSKELGGLKAWHLQHQLWFQHSPMCLPALPGRLLAELREQGDKWPVCNAVMPISSYGKCVSLSKQLITNLWLRQWSIKLIRYGKHGNWYKEEFLLRGLRLTWQMTEWEWITYRENAAH